MHATYRIIHLRFLKILLVAFVPFYQNRKSSYQQVHLYGTALGGFLAQLFAQHRPRRVRSLVLSNSYLETRSFAAAMPWAPIVGWAPPFLLKRYVLTGLRDGPHEPFIADSVDFVVSQVETLSKDDLASRLTLTADAASVGPLLLSDCFITIMDTNDYCSTPQQLKDQVIERYPGARQAYLKNGGDFPFLSRPDEVNLHLQLHLRRVGVEPQPGLVRGISEEASGSGGGSSGEGGGGDSGKPNDGKEDGGDTPKDDMGSSGIAPPESQPPPVPESPDSQHSDNQLLSNAKLGAAGIEILPLFLLHAILGSQQYSISTDTSLHFTWEFCTLYLLSLHVANLYINLDWESHWKFRQVV